MTVPDACDDVSDLRLLEAPDDVFDFRVPEACDGASNFKVSEAQGFGGVFCLEYLKLVMTCLKSYSQQLFADRFHVRHTALVSAKTGYGIEDLVTVLLDDWGKQGQLCWVKVKVCSFEVINNFLYMYLGVYVQYVHRAGCF